MEKFPVDDLNLSFSGDEEASQLFLTQSSFSEVSTQQVDDAISFLESLDNGFPQENAISLSPHAVEMTEREFNFRSGDADNGWSVTGDEAPFKVTRHSDGEVFVVGQEKEKSVEEAYEEIQVIPPINRELESHLKRFSSIVTAADLDASKYKR